MQSIQWCLKDFTDAWLKKTISSAKVSCSSVGTSPITHNSNRNYPELHILLVLIGTPLPWQIEEVRESYPTLPTSLIEIVPHQRSFHKDGEWYCFHTRHYHFAKEFIKPKHLHHRVNGSPLINISKAFRKSTMMLALLNVFLQLKPWLNSCARLIQLEMCLHFINVVCDSGMRLVSRRREMYGWEEVKNCC